MSCIFSIIMLESNDMKSHFFCKVVDKKKVCENVFEFSIKFDNLPYIEAGQFLNIKTNSQDNILRRPFCIFDVDKKQNTLKFVFMIRGSGTTNLAKVEVGDTVDVMLPLGNGWDKKYIGKKVLLVGGGVGIFPLYMVAKTFGNNVSAILGFRSKEHIMFQKEFAKVTKDLIIATDDGSYGKKGFVTSIAKEQLSIIKPDVIFACGPHIMFANLKKALEGSNVPCFISLEEKMACGYGACVCCTTEMIIDGKQERKRICCEGPVFNMDEVVLS